METVSRDLYRRIARVQIRQITDEGVTRDLDADFALLPRVPTLFSRLLVLPQSRTDYYALSRVSA